MTRVYNIKKEDLTSDDRVKFFKIISLDSFSPLNQLVLNDSMSIRDVSSIYLATDNTEAHIGTIRYSLSYDGNLFSGENILNIKFNAYIDDLTCTTSYESISEILYPNLDVNYTMIVGKLYLQGYLDLDKPIVVLPLLSRGVIQDEDKESISALTISNVPSSMTIYASRGGEYVILNNNDTFNMLEMEHIYGIFTEANNYESSISITITNSMGEKSYLTLGDIQSKGEEFDVISVREYNKLVHNE